MRNKYYIKDLAHNQVIHAPTEETAQKLCEKFHELGLQWNDSSSYSNENCWRFSKEETCYNLTSGSHGSKKWYKEKGYEILTIEQLMDFEKPLKTKTNLSIVKGMFIKHSDHLGKYTSGAIKPEAILHLAYAFLYQLEGEQREEFREWLITTYNLMD